MDTKYSIGIDAGGTKVAYGLFAPDGTLVCRRQHPTDAKTSGPDYADEMLLNIEAILSENGIGYDALLGVGVCMPSFILFDEGRILMTSAMPGIKDFPMRAYMQSRISARVVLDNDSNAAALAEFRFGAGRGKKHMVYMATGTGLGSGIIIDGKVFRGSYGWAGESGHMLATPDEGVLCGCENRGCYMSYASGCYLGAQVERRKKAGAKSSLTALSNGEDVLCAYNKGDALAEELIKSMAHYIAVCVFNVYQMLNIDTFVFGGGLVHYGDALFAPLRAEFDRYNHIPLPVYFKMAELKANFGIIGAAAFLKEN